MSRALTIESVGQAFAVVKEMQVEGLGWGDDYRPLGRLALTRILEERMAVAVERHLEQMAELDEPDRRNGFYARRLLTSLGSVELAVPRTRTFSACSVLRAYARREPEIDRMILACFVLGLSTRKVGEALLPILGQRVSPSTVSSVAKTLDAAVAGFHARPLKAQYRQLMLDGVVLARRTGAGAIRRPVLVALGIRPDGRKEVIDFRLAGSESAVEWERFLTSLYRRGLTGEGLELICARACPRESGGRQRAARRPASGLSRPRRPALLGAQDQERAEQGPQGRPAPGQTRPPRRHERRRSAASPRRRPPLR